MNWKFWQPRVPECNHEWANWIPLEIGASKFTIVVKQSRTCILCNYTDVNITTRSS